MCPMHAWFIESSKENREGLVMGRVAMVIFPVGRISVPLLATTSQIQIVDDVVLVSCGLRDYFQIVHRQAVQC